MVGSVTVAAVGVFRPPTTRGSNERLVGVFTRIKQNKQNKSSILN